MRRYLPAGLLALVALWVAGRVIVAPRLEARVLRAAEEALRSGPEARAWRDVTVTASGREITLAGRVREAGASEAARERIENSLSLASRLTNNIRVEPLPPGFVLLGRVPGGLRLAGVVASAMEREDILAEVRRLHGKPGLALKNEIAVDDEAVAPSKSPQTTLRSVPLPEGEEAELGWLAAARMGESWRMAPLDGSATPEATLPASQRTPPVMTLLAEAKAFREAAKKSRAEHKRLSALPPPHLLLCARRGDILVRGELASAAAKTRCIEELLAAFKGWRITDSLRVSAGRNPFSNLDTLLDDLPRWPAGGEADCAAGIAGGGWIALELAGVEAGAALEPKLRGHAKLPGLIEDARECQAWLKTDAIAHAQPPPWLALVVLSDRVYLSGEMADEAARSQILPSVRAAYPGRHLIHKLTLNPACQLAPQVLQTLKTLPPPPSAAQGIAAFAILGQTWQSRDLETGWLHSAGLAASGLLPGKFPADRAFEGFVDGFDAFKSRAWRAKRGASSR